MKRFVAALAFLALVPAAPSGAAQEAAGFQPPAERIEKPYTNDKCLKNCHGVPGFGAGGVDGRLRDLHVDATGYVMSIHGQKGVECIDCHEGADPNEHPRAGYPDVDCRACHAKKPPEGVFPAGALDRLAAKGIKPPPEKSLKGDDWAGTKHAKAWVRGERDAPFCPQCHTAHQVRPAADPASTVNRANLSDTCGACHRDQVRDLGPGGFLARFRLAGHGKGDLSNRYDVTECASCHQGEAAHGETTVTGQACPRCHQVPEDRSGPTYVSLHVKPGSADQPAARALRWAYAAVFWGGVGVAVLVVVLIGFTTLYTKQDD